MDLRAVSARGRKSNLLLNAIHRERLSYQWHMLGEYKSLHIQKLCISPVQLRGPVLKSRLEQHRNIWRKHTPIFMHTPPPTDVSGVCGINGFARQWAEQKIHRITSYLGVSKRWLWDKFPRIARTGDHAEEMCAHIYWAKPTFPLLK